MMNTCSFSINGNKNQQKIQKTPQNCGKSANN